MRDSPGYRRFQTVLKDADEEIKCTSMKNHFQWDGC